MGGEAINQLMVYFGGEFCYKEKQRDLERLEGDVEPREVYIIFKDW